MTARDDDVDTEAPEGPVPAAGRGQRVLDVLDRAIGVHGSLVARNVARARQRNPDATPAQVIRNLERMYVSALAGTGAAVGGAATAPGVGTGIGGGANAAVAGLAARAARRAFGPPPEVWTYEGEVVDVVDAP